MRKRIGKKTYDIYATDFETHNDYDLIKEFEKNPKQTKTSIWLWYIIDENTKWNDRKSYGFDLDSYFERLKELSKPNTHLHRAGNIMIYDFNLAFEWSFMIYWLQEHNFVYKAKFEDSDINCYNLICTRSMSSVWQVNLKLNKGNSIVVFKDLAKILGGGSLRKLAKSYQLETQKGDIEYTFNRRVYYDDFDMPHVIDDRAMPPHYIPTNEELIYCYKDVKIIMDILAHEKTQNDKIFWKSVSSASYSVAKGIQFAYPKAFKPVQTYRKRYPVLSEEECSFIREGYGGGIAYCTPRYQYKDIKKGKRYNGMLCNGIIHIDMHNAHPSAMYSKDFALLKGQHFTIGKKLDLKSYKGFIWSNRICCLRIKISYTAVKLHSVIKLIGFNQIYDAELVVWDFEILTMYHCYENLSVEVIEGYAYKKDKLPFANFFKENYDIRKEAKRTGDAYEINHRKLLNNSFYGKLNERGHNETFIPYLDDLGLINTNVQLHEDINYMGKYTYLPVGTAVPAYTRVWLIETALLFGYKNILYFDTDSIFMLDNEETRAVLETLPMQDDLCNWGIEEHALEGQFACPKRYKLKLDSDTLEAHVAGFNISKNEDFDKLDIIRSSRYINRAYRIKGGTLITTQLKTLSVDKKYQLIYHENYQD